MATTVATYTNDTLHDLVYLLVFNYLSLQERVRLRIICQRWKNIIEADCAQMRTLRVFGKADHLDDYLRRTKYVSIVPSTSGESVKTDPSPMNTIILKRPASDRVDIHFLARLFPTISNLAIEWTFGDSLQEFIKILENGKRSKFKVSSVHEPDIFALLSTWAPTLRSLYLVTLNYYCSEPEFNDGRWKQSFHTKDLDASRIPDFWKCISLMAPTLQKLVFEGVNLRTAPEWLTMPALEEVILYYSTHNIFPEELNRIAPALQSFGLPWGVYKDPQLGSLALPTTVKQMIIALDATSLEDAVVPCPSITHLKVKLNKNYLELLSGVVKDPADLFTKLMAKFPNINSLTIFDGDMLHVWLISKGKELGTHQSSELFGGIEELTLKAVTNDFPEGTSSEKEDNWLVYFFRGISTQFKGLKKLTLAIEPDSEVAHCKLSETLTRLKDQFIPRVALAFALDMSVEERKLPFIVQSQCAVASPLPSPLDLSFCCLSPGCVFAPIFLPN